MAKAPSRGTGEKVPSPRRQPSLREAHKALTRARILDALAELIREEHPLEVSMAAVAAQAGVSETTLYRYFPPKRDLFAGLASAHHDHVAGDVAPDNPEQLAADLRVVYRRAAA